MLLVMTILNFTGYFRIRIPVISSGANWIYGTTYYFIYIYQQTLSDPGPVYSDTDSGLSKRSQNIWCDISINIHFFVKVIMVTIWELTAVTWMLVHFLWTRTPTISSEVTSRHIESYHIHIWELIEVIRLPLFSRSMSSITDSGQF